MCIVSIVLYEIDQELLLQLRRIDEGRYNRFILGRGSQLGDFDNAQISNNKQITTMRISLSQALSESATSNVQLYSRSACSQSALRSGQ